MTFWVAEPARAKAEKLSVATLEERSSWLTAVAWRIDQEGRLTARFTIRHADEDFGIVMTYPDLFPDVPPILVPIDGRRLSDHQYPSGELCLEHRADNWSPDVTGAEMIESAYKLISGERAGAYAPPVPSAHEVALGQMLRVQFLRFLVREADLRSLREKPPCSTTAVRLRIQSAGGSIVSFLEATDVDEEAKTDVERKPAGSWHKPAVAVRMPGAFELRDDASVEELAKLVSLLGLSELAASIESGGETIDIVLVSDTMAQLMMISEFEGKRTLTRDATVVLPDVVAERTHRGHHALRARSVGIVGCGSIGSKLATILARSGVGRFVLVDHDILMPENLQRHDLDWRFVGGHKADGQKQRISDVSDGAEVAIRRIALGGQESSMSLTSTLDELASCDLIVDATAEGSVFNYCASICRSRLKPMLWVEVLAGGIGGLVARSRPNLDPPPQEARRQIARWTEEQGVPAPAAAQVRYGAGDDAVLIADDADVSTVAAHAARLAVDTLLRPDESAFPSSAYFLGLTRSWIFEAPFDTWPVDYLPEGVWGSAIDPDRTTQALELLQDLVAKDGDADTPAA